MTLNSKKSRIEKQNYEDYWKLTLGTSDFFGDQFIRTLRIIIQHIDENNLANKSINQLIKNPFAKKKNVKEEIVKYKELQDKIKFVYPNDDNTNASTRKQINQYIKLGFIKPYLNGYNKGALEYIKANKSKEDLQRIFSETVYEHASFNSSVTNDNKSNQIKFIVKTLLNRESKVLNIDELVGIMQLNIENKDYAKEKEILNNKNWAINIEFAERKYNQIRYILHVLKKLELFATFNMSKKNIKSFYITLKDNANEFLGDNKDTQRDRYRFALMKKAVIQESIDKYNRKVCWLTKEPSEGLVVSHIYASNLALKNWDIDEAYDPNNAFLLKPGDVDSYFDKYKITFNEKGKVIFSDKVREDFEKLVIDNNYHIDEKILNAERKKYLQIHNSEFYRRYQI